MPLSKHFRFCLWWESFFNGCHFSTCQTRKKLTPVTFFLHMRHVFLRPGAISLRRKMTHRSIFDGVDIRRYTGIVREKEIYTLRQCVFPFRSKKKTYIRYFYRLATTSAVAQCGASRTLDLTDGDLFPAEVFYYFFFWKDVFLCFYF